MANPTGEFLGKSSGFLRNPLGIIGLLIGLIYGVATIVSGASPHLTEAQRWVMVGFAAIFPVVILAAFYRLVTLHHSKLYAPGDWRDERFVFGPQTAAVREWKVEAEVKQLEAAEAQQLAAPAREVVSSDPKPASPRPSNTSGTETAPTVPQADAVELTSGVGAADRAIARGGNRVTRVGDAAAFVHEADDLVFRALSREYGSLVYRDVVLRIAGRDIALDGVIELKDRIIGVEVKTARYPKNLLNRIDEALLLAAAATKSFADRGPDVRFEFLLVLVTEGMSESEHARVRARAEQRVAQSGIPARVRIFAIEELRKDDGSSDAAA